MTQNSTYLLLHSTPFKSTISSWQPPRCYSEFNFLLMETGCQLVPKMFSVTFLSGFCPQTINFYAIFTYGNNLQDFLYASLDNVAVFKLRFLLKERVCSHASKFFPFKVYSTLEGKQSGNNKAEATYPVAW